MLLNTTYEQLFGIDSDIFGNTVNLIESRGFRADSHQVTTNDGYYLSVYRIRNPYINGSTGRPIILWHGITSSSDVWLINGAGQLKSAGLYIENNVIVNDCETTVASNLALTLSACGYDVWLPNSRGNYYSRAHQTLNSDTDENYWKYTFTEMGVYDVPAVIEYIMKITNKDSIGYIGHSLGSTSMFIQLSIQPQFERFVRPFIALAPFVYMSHMTGLMRYVLYFERILRSTPRVIGLPIPIAQFISIFICANQYFREYCADFTYALSGHDPDNLNITRIPIYMSKMGNSQTSWLFAQIAQLIRSGTFSLFDHGDPLNFERYGQTRAPDYPLSQIISKNIAIYYGLNDNIANYTDVLTLINKLKVPLLENYLIPFPEWAHQDFHWGIHADSYVNTRVLRLLKQFN